MKSVTTYLAKILSRSYALPLHMVGNLSQLILAETSSPGGATAPGASVPVLVPSIVLVLCIFAGVGTLLLLPGRRDISFRRIGGGMLATAALIFASLIMRIESGVGIYFWIFSAIALAGAVRVITHPRPVYSALYFVLTVFASAGLFVLLDAEFMAAALVLIYAGAILITYVFVIMLASQARAPGSTANFLSEYDTISREPLIGSMVGFTLMGMLMFVIFDKAAAIQPNPPAKDEAALKMEGATQKLGVYLFQSQMVDLEVAGLILTISMVGAIVIARKRVVYHEGLRTALGCHGCPGDADRRQPAQYSRIWHRQSPAEGVSGDLSMITLISLEHTSPSGRSCS